MTSFGAELRKLMRPLVYVLAIAFGLWVLRWSLIVFHDAANSASLAATGRTHPIGGGTPATLDASSLAALRADEARAHAALSLTGALAFSLRMLASIPGLIAVTILVSGHLAGEWPLRTARDLLARDRGDVRVVGAKAASALVAIGAWALVGAAAVLTSGVMAHEPVHLLHVGNFGSVARAIGVAALVLALFVAVAALASVVVKSVVGAIGAVAAFWSVNFFLMAQVAPQASFSYWVASWWQFRPASGFYSDHIWQDAFSGVSGLGNRPVSGLVLAICCLGCLALAVGYLRRSPERA